MDLQTSKAGVVELLYMHSLEYAVAEPPLDHKEQVIPQCLHESNKLNKRRKAKQSVSG